MSNVNLCYFLISDELDKSECNSVDEQGFRFTSETSAPPFASLTSLADLAWTPQDSPKSSTSCYLIDLHYKGWFIKTNAFSLIRFLLHDLLVPAPGASAVSLI